MSTAAVAQEIPRTRLWRSRAWISLLIAVPPSVCVVFSTPLGSSNVWMSSVCQTLGWCLFVLGAAFRWWATLYIGNRKDRGEVVTGGPYSVCRHPLYFGTCLMGLSVAAFFESLTLTVCLLAAGFVYLGITLPREEQRLVAFFGDSYRQYMARVPRLIPSLMTFQSPEMIEVHLAGLRAELRRMARWMWIPLLAHSLVHLRAEAWWPHWMQLP